MTTHPSSEVVDHVRKHLSIDHRIRNAMLAIFDDGHATTSPKPNSYNGMDIGVGRSVVRICPSSFRHGVIVISSHDADTLVTRRDVVNIVDPSVETLCAAAVGFSRRFVDEVPAERPLHPVAVAPAGQSWGWARKVVA